jgi:predicted acetyltransferase
MRHRPPRYTSKCGRITSPSCCIGNRRCRGPRSYNLTYRVRGCQLAAVVGDDIVGRASLRFELNEFFAQKGGHVGYGVAPAHRRQGYATEILRESLIILRAEGIEHVLVTCDDNNLGSVRVIEHNGGVLESVVPFEVDGKNVGLRRYWID